MLALLAGCIENQVGSPDPGSAGVPPVWTPPPAPELVVDAPPAFDPLRKALPIEVHGPPDAAFTLTATGSDGVAWEQDGTTDADGAAAASWDGHALDGSWSASGAYTLDAAFEEGSGTAEVVSLRVGFVTAWLEGDDGVTGTREPLYWPIDRVVSTDADPVASLAALDVGDRPQDLPDVPEGPMARRPDGAEPVAFAFDSRPVLTLGPATTWDRGSTGIDDADVTVEADGWTVISGVPVRADQPVVLQLDQPLGDSVGVSTLDVDLAFSAGGSKLGHQHLPLRIYRVVGPSGFGDASDPYRAWAPVLESALPAIDGTPADANAVVDALVDFVFADLGLRYDTQSGSSAYSDYGGFDLSRPKFLLTDFLQRRFGSVINCSDAANILGAYVNMTGVPLDHLILDPGFDLNYIEAIGNTTFTHCPFGPGGCGFNYHAVTTIPDSDLIWDATLALDGDTDPSHSPSTALMVEEIPADEYLSRLVMQGSPRYNNEMQETLQ